MQNPFSTTYSKLPEQTYISTLESGSIIENFSYDSPTEAVYKITGLRGSGKTVLLSKIQAEFTNDQNKEKGWIVYNLNPSRDMLRQVAASLVKESFLKESPNSKNIDLSASIMGTGMGVGIGSSKNENLFDIGVEIKNMLSALQKKNKKLMICVDEVSKTQEMVVFALEFGNWLMSGFPVYFVCTGLYENIQELGNTKNLTFFRRGRTVETKPLNAVRMMETYKNKLQVDSLTAKTLAEMTKGYAYAFQMLGSLYFSGHTTKSLEEIEGELKTELFSYSYEKVWEELSDEDKNLARLLAGKKEYKREEVLKLMGEKSGNYSVYRDRLLKRGVITARQGYISLNPPYFSEYIREYGN